MSDFYVFQQDSAPAHRTRETIELLTMETQSSFLLRLNPVDYKVWSVMQKKVYKKRIKDIDELRARILTAWGEMDQRISMQQSDSGAHVFVHALKLNVDTLNTLSR